MKIGTPPDGALPLVVAPFATMHLTANPRDGSISDIGEGEMSAIHRRLARMADVDRAEIDRNRGLFRFLLPEQESRAVGLVSWLSISPFADDEEIARALTSFPPVRARIIKDATREMWEAILRNLEMLVRAKSHSIIAQIKTPLAECYDEIPPRAWNYFRVEDWRTGICFCESSGDRLFDVHVQANGLSVTQARANARGKKGCFEKLVALRNEHSKPLKSKDGYFEELAPEFGVGPWQFDQVWTEAAKAVPREEWSKTGPKPKS